MNLITRGIFGLLFSFMSCGLVGQNIDYINQLNDSAFAIVSTHPETGEKLAIEALFLSRKIGYSEGIVGAYSAMASYFNIKGQCDSSIEYTDSAFVEMRKYPKEDHFRKALLYSSKGLAYDGLGEMIKSKECFEKSLEQGKLSGDKNRIAVALMNLGVNYSRRAEDDKAMEFFLASAKIKEQLDDKRGLIYINNNIGSTLNSYNEFEKAREHYKTSLKLSKETKDEYSESWTLALIGQTYVNSGEMKKALRYFFKTLAIDIRLDNKDAILESYTDIGGAFQGLENYDSAIVYYEKGVELTKVVDDFGILGVIQGGLGTCYLKKGDYQRAKFYLDSAYQKGVKIQDPVRTILVARELKELYKKLKEPEKVYFYYDVIAECKDSIRSNEIRSIENKLDLERERKKTAILEAERELNNANLEKLNLIIIACVGLLIVLFSALILKIRKNRAYRKLMEKNLSEMKEERSVVLELSQIKTTKYTSIEITNEQKEDIEKGLLSIMKEDKIFIKPDLTINLIATKLNTNSSYLSRVINESFDKNFNAFVNEFRVKEARKMLSDEKNKNYTIEYIGKSVGFRSKSVFNTAFKTYTGLTPSYFKKSALANVA